MSAFGGKADMRGSGLLPCKLTPEPHSLAASLAHPGGNATGSSNVASDLSAKLLETFAQLVPGMSSVIVV
jgi:hypothetical protein